MLINVLTQAQNCLSRGSKSNPRLCRFRLFEMELLFLQRLPRSCKRSFVTQVSQQNLLHISDLPHTCHMSGPWHYSLHFIIRKIFGENIKSWNSTLRNFIQRTGNSFLWPTDQPQHPTLRAPWSLCSFPS